MSKEDESESEKKKNDVMICSGYPEGWCDGCAPDVFDPNEDLIGFEFDMRSNPEESVRMRVTGSTAWSNTYVALDEVNAPSHREPIRSCASAKLIRRLVTDTRRVSVSLSSPTDSNS